MSIFARVAMCFLVITLAFATGGCAFGDRHAKYSYTPVMLVKADKPCAVSVATLACQGKTGERAQIGQLRNVYQIPTAKVLCAQGDPMIWTSDALAAELQHAGFTVQRVSETATPTPGQVCIRGVVKEFFADMTTQVVMKVRVSFTVARDNNTLLDQAFDVDEGLGMFTASDEDYEKLANQALERLMRRAAPVIIAALQKTTP